MRRGCTKHPEYRSVGWNSESIITQSHNKFYSRWRRSSVLLIIILLLEFSFCLIVVVVLEFFISTVGALALTLIWWLPRPLAQLDICRLTYVRLVVFNSPRSHPPPSLLPHHHLLVLSRQTYLICVSPLFSRSST